MTVISVYVGLFVMGECPGENVQSQQDHISYVDYYTIIRTLSV